MNTSSLASLVAIPNLKTIKVKFPDTDKLYTYKTVDESIQADDFVIVSFNDALVKIARVIEVDTVPDLTKDLHYKWIVQKVDFSTYIELNNTEKETFIKLRELETQSLVNSAEQLLADKLNVDVDQLKNTLNSDVITNSKT